MTPEKLYAWRRGTPPQRIGVIQAQAGVYRLAEGPEELGVALAKLQTQDYLPLTLRKDLGGNRSITMKRLSPGDDDYWQALAEALDRQFGYALTTSP